LVDEDSAKKAALNCFDAQKNWKQINRQALECKRVWKNWRPGKEKEDFRGRLIQELIAAKFPNLKEYGWPLLEQTAKGFETDVK
jgi:hypothetical protein